LNPRPTVLETAREGSVCRVFPKRPSTASVTQVRQRSIRRATPPVPAGIAGAWKPTVRRSRLRRRGRREPHLVRPATLAGRITFSGSAPAAITVVYRFTGSVESRTSPRTWRAGPCPMFAIRILSVPWLSGAAHMRDGSPLDVCSCLPERAREYMEQLRMDEIPTSGSRSSSPPWRIATTSARSRRGCATPSAAAIPGRRRNATPSRRSSGSTAP
jgi:hypothetical protein